MQTAYGKEDLGALRTRVTPEMLSYYSEELAANASRGVVNRISDVKLQQGDLAEAWREGDTDYATVAMRYSLIDQIVDPPAAACSRAARTRPPKCGPSCATTAASGWSRRSSRPLTPSRRIKD